MMSPLVDTSDKPRRPHPSRFARHLLPRAGEGGASSRLLFALAVGAFVAALTLAPLLTLLIGSFRPEGLPSSPGFTLEHYADVWGAARNWRLLGNSLAFAGASAGIAIGLGGALSWLIERTDLPARDFFRALILMPMATPPLLLAIGWALVLAPKIGIVSIALAPLVGPIDRWFEIYSFSGAVFVQSLAYVPTAVLMLSPAIRALDPALEEAALVAGATRGQIIWRIGLPILRPALLSVATILVIIGVLAFDVPAVIGIPGHVDLLSIEIFRLMTPPSGFPEYGPAAATNTILLALLTIGLLLYRHTLNVAARFATITGKGYKPAEVRLGRWRGVAAGLVGAYFVLAVALPFIALFWASVIPYFAGFSLAMLDRASFKAYGDLLASARLREAFFNASLISVIAAAALTLISLAIAWIVLRAKLKRAWLLDALAMIPLGVPPLMTGIALVFVAFSLKFLPLYGTIWIIALGHVIAFMPIASRMMQSGMLQITGELEEAAHMAGATAARTVWRVLLPLLVPTLMAMIVWILVHSVREFSIAVMLQSGRNGVLSTMLFNFWETGSPERAAALAVMLMTLLLALTATFSLLTPRERAN